VVRQRYTFTARTRESRGHLDSGTGLWLPTGRSYRRDPLAQKEAYSLIKKLCDEDFEVLIETGGFFSTEDVDERAAIILDVKCPASGEEARNHWPNLGRLRADRTSEIRDRQSRGLDYAAATIERYELERRARAVLISPAWNEIDLKDWLNGSRLADSVCGCSFSCTSTSGDECQGV